MIYEDMIKTYMAMSQYISNQVQQNGKHVMNYTLIKKMRSVRSDVIKVTSTFIDNCTQHKLVADKLLKPSVKLLEDYASTNPDSR